MKTLILLVVGGLVGGLLVFSCVVLVELEEEEAQAYARIVLWEWFQAGGEIEDFPHWWELFPDAEPDSIQEAEWEARREAIISMKARDDQQRNRSRESFLRNLRMAESRSGSCGRKGKSPNAGRLSTLV